MSRMTWIKPSFLWMMYRCGWASKEGQAVVDYVNDWIVSITDITDYVKELDEQRKAGVDITKQLPQEKIYN